MKGEKTMKLTKKQILMIACVGAIILLFVACTVLSVLLAINLKPDSLQEIQPQEGSPLVIENSVENGIMLTSGVATTASDGTVSQTITATAYDSDGATTQSAFYWEAIWNDSTAEWAVGKDVADYVGLTPSEDTQSCTLVCAKGFSEQIIVRVSCKAKPKVYATLTLDYVKRITSLSGESTFVNGVKAKTGNCKLNMCAVSCENHTSDHENIIKVAVNYSSIGTVTGDFVVRDMYSCSMSNENAQNITSAISGLSSVDLINNTIDLVDVGSHTYTFDYRLNDFSGVAGEINEQVCDFLLDNESFTMHYGLHIDLVYNGQVVQSFVSTDASRTSMCHFECGFNTDYLTYKVTNIALSDSSIFF